MADFTARQIIGKWKKGYALDIHTISSTPIGYNELGHMQFDTVYSEVGKLLYELKSNGNVKVVPEIVAAIENWIQQWKPPIDVIVPVPPSKKRHIPPVITVANEMSKRLRIPLVDCVSKTREETQLKDVKDLDTRLKLLDSLHKVDHAAIAGKRVLLFDDLYRSGATMNAITAELYETGKATEVFALTITKTRTNQ